MLTYREDVTDYEELARNALDNLNKACNNYRSVGVSFGTMADLLHDSRSLTAQTLQAAGMVNTEDGH